MASISDIYLERGAANAAGARTKGNIYGQLIRNLGSLPGQLVQEQRQGQLDAQKYGLDQQEMQMRAGELADRQAARQAETAGRAQQSKVDSVIGAIPFNDDGTIDVGAVQKKAAETDPTLVGHAVATANNLNDQAAKHRETLSKAEKAALDVQTARSDALGHSALALLDNKGGIDPGSYQLAIGSFVKNKLIDPQQADQLLAAQTPEQMAGNVQRLVGGSKTASEALAKRTAPAEKVTYGAPQAFNGAPGGYARPGSNGKMYDLYGKEITGGLTAAEPKMTPYQEQEIALRKADGERAAAAAKATADAKAAAAAKGKPLSSRDVEKVTDLDKATGDLNDLRTALSGEGTTGTAAAIGAHMPGFVTSLTGLGEKSKEAQAQIDRVRQTIGRAIHGGVMRKNDQEQAEKFLPVIGDPPALVAAKIDNLQKMIDRSKVDHLGNLARSGYDVSQFGDAGAAPAAAAAPKADPLGLFK